LAARRPGRAVAALIVIMLALFGIHALGATPLLLIIAAVLLLASIAEFLLPVTYTLDAEGAHMRQLLNHRILPWPQVRRVYLTRNGIKLSPLVARTLAENYRGVQLRTFDRDATLELVRAWLDAAGVSPEIVEDA